MAHACAFHTAGAVGASLVFGRGVQRTQEEAGAPGSLFLCPDQNLGDEGGAAKGSLSLVVLGINPIECTIHRTSLLRELWNKSKLLYMAKLPASLHMLAASLF